MGFPASKAQLRAALALSGVALQSARVLHYKPLAMLYESPQIAEKLRRAGLRPTRQRLALARLLFNAGDRHVSAEALHAEALAAKVPVSLATVYNTLNQFTRAGLLREVAIEGNRSYFDTNTSNHFHYFLEDKGHLVDFGAEQVEVTGLPALPEGTAIDRIDVIVRLRRA